ncbi:hypothetical protein VF14_18545 [Nostoc linckia z18]|uniref:Uncharacterized protein n=2 Tax=Nostoc linckia TaxID=92942 RepID=A0A9Q5Z586_NOSLI|nr:hypothetical protein [Nostoc linckia]PHJ50694.1 hypothetical protein VF02_38075 [Nostoc linckia z1]PHJ81998.1 hypothetical protein VF07_29355 [Nostoc linckia z6]PHJ83735.1 hypothetical protein VF04_36555 [Nostoc linckia z7]PHJ94035.1 hypothetical protein VF08_34465 [Nostoc linckia z8]PHK09342.1 hypothetical protein VF09_16130 [Nostoc linckia z9]
MVEKQQQMTPNQYDQLIRSIKRKIAHCNIPENLSQEEAQELGKELMKTYKKQCYALDVAKALYRDQYEAIASAKLAARELAARKVGA